MKKPPKTFLLIMQYSPRHVQPTNSFDSFQSGSYKGEVVVVVEVAHQGRALSRSLSDSLSLSLSRNATQRNALQRRVGTGNDGVAAPRIQVATTTCSSDTVVLASQTGFKEAVLVYNVQCRSGFPLE
jgi:hypothetical protein